MRQSLLDNLTDDLGRIAGNSPVIATTGPRLHPGERRDVAVLFLDISGFTALAERLDFELVHHLVNGIMQSFSGIVSSGGGYVDKLEGDRIMALFGAEQAGDNDSVRAVDSSLRMLRTLDQVNEMLSGEGIEVEARAGVSYGQVIVAPDACGHLTATGDVVNVASRLADMAPLGCTAVSERARNMCGDFHRWSDLGEIVIRGRSAPVHAFQPIGPGEVLVQRWQRAARISGTPHLGREREMSLLRATWQGLGSGSLAVVSIMGEAGIGKSRLLHEFAGELARSSDAPVVLSGRNLSFSQPPLGLWSTMLSDAIAGDFLRDSRVRSPEALLERLVFGTKAVRGEDLAGTLPFLRSLLSLDHGSESLSEMSQDSRRREMMISLRKIIEAVSASSDVLLLLEDIQWADAASSEVLDFVLEGLRPVRRVLILLSYRTDGDGETSPAPANQVISLHELEKSEGRLIIGHMLGGEVGQGVEDAVLERSGGNPFFIEEMVLDLIESGRLVESGSGWEHRPDHFASPAPASLGGIIRSRIDRLSGGLKSGLLLASVLGSEFTDDLFARVNGFVGNGIPPIECLDWLHGRGFLKPMDFCGEPGRRFTHLLMRDAAYDMLLYRNRTILHRFAAQALEQDCAGGRSDMAVVIADHWDLAGDSGKAIEWGLRALAHCELHFLNEEGLGVTDRLLRWIKGQPGSSYRDNSLFEVMMAREKFLGLLGLRDEQAQLLHELESIAENAERRDWMVMVRGRLGRMQIHTGMLEQARETLAPAILESAALCGSEAHGGMLADMAALCIKQGRPLESIDLAREALRLFRECGDRNAECMAINSLGIANWNMEMLPEALDCFQTANELSRETRNRWYEGNTLLNIGVIHRCLGDLDKAREFYRKALKLTGETGNLQSEANAHANLGILALLEDRLTDAGKHYDSALVIYRKTGNRLLELQTLAKLGRLATRDGRYRDAESLFRQSLAIQEETGQTLDEGETLHSLAELLILTGRTDRADQVLKRALEVSIAAKDGIGEAKALCMLVGIEVAGGNHKRAAELYLRAMSACQGNNVGEELDLKLKELAGKLGMPGPPGHAPCQTS
ncbi:MAG: tetratricopeptide repeat protein [Candidatus Fermentibacteraceae bacterium]